jgi:hypothetical protein
MAGGWIQGVDYVVTDATRSVVAVVRPVPGRPPGGVPRWAGDVNACAVVVVGPDGAAGLVITKRGYDVAAHILIKPKAQVGLVTSEGERSPRNFSDCTCKMRRRTCICGAQSGRVQPPLRGDRAWTVIDAQRHEVGRITPRPFAIERGHTSDDGGGGRLARWARSAARSLFPIAPAVCKVVEAEPGFDWRRHGLLVALAALCDPNAAHFALWRPPGVSEALDAVQ